MIIVFEELGDIDSKANTLWSIANIKLEKGDLKEAVELLSELYKINMELGRLDGICFVWLDLGQVMCHGGMKEEGLVILNRSKDGFQKMGMGQYVELVQGVIDGIDKKG